MQIARKPFFSVMSITLIALLITACTSNLATGLDTGPVQKADRQYPLMSAKDCADLGGELVGDIGDGRIHDPDYLCNNGTAPIGTIRTQDEPIMTEGAVCCGP